MGHSPTGCKELDTTERLREILPGKRNILGQSENGITIIIWFFLKNGKFWLSWPLFLLCWSLIATSPSHWPPSLLAS